MNNYPFKHVVILMLCLGVNFTIHTLHAQQLSVLSGRVYNAQGKPVPGSHVLLLGTTQGSVTDDQGAFAFSGITAGLYQLEVSAIGYQRVRKEVLIEAGKNKELTIALKENSTQLEQVVVTATRTARLADEVPVPLQVVNASQIRQIGAMRLTDVLAEQTGLQLIQDHGTGIQVQGLDADYTLILLDGEPLIGRSGGTLDLDRLSVGNIERIEVLKGPSSALYGSEAMGGVINIITQGQKDHQGIWGTAKGQYRSFQKLDLNLEGGLRTKRLGASLFVNRNSSEGFDLDPSTVSQTAPPYTSHTVQPKLRYRFAENINLELSGRFYHEKQENTSEVEINERMQLLDEESQLKEGNLTSKLTWQLEDKHLFTLKNYTTRYKTLSEIFHREDGSAYSTDEFTQWLSRSELKYDVYFNDRQISTVGAGYTLEKLDADRYSETDHFNTWFGFAQHQWIPHKRFNLTAGFRFDAHSHYADRISPKLAALWKPFDWLSLQSSIGGAYKAPDFRQLMLNFTNPTVGYTVLGSTLVKEGLDRLIAEKQVIESDILLPLAEDYEIKAENSMGYNVGFALNPISALKLNTNFFRNDIHDLIETVAIARKTNQQYVYTYINRNKVRTQGIEIRATYALPVKGMEIGAGYNYLDTRDLEDWENLKAGKVIRKNQATGKNERVKKEEYEGLFNRSRHSGNIKLSYRNSRYLYGLSVRGIYRGRYGWRDMDQSGLLDQDSEYADGYWMFHISVNKTLWKNLTVDAGVQNALDLERTEGASIPGRIWYAGLAFNFSKEKK
ncbi:TonB-dependent receptor [Rapidithrix thailandica]|uniref:TonB-dependent receptor n=1 Tax=Rapidithrix thailandica TaxID=413964 RepID=A0AAW9SAA6_9BACT